MMRGLTGREVARIAEIISRNAVQGIFQKENITRFFFGCSTNITYV